jgi:signal transduction histidine kinase
MDDLLPTADRLARLAELENDFQRALEAEKLEAMAEFAAGAGHEINNPLTVISGRAQLLLRGESDPERRHALALISVQAMRVYEMIADMMLFARPPRPEPARCNVVGLIAAVVADLAPTADRQETRVTYLGPQEPVEIEADGTQLSVALRALCQNALEALGNGGHVEIGLNGPAKAGFEAVGSPPANEGTDPGEHFLAVSSPAKTAADSISLGEVRISVRDDGPGITPEQRRHIFEPFYSARQAGRGLGLGLSKAWRIVTQHGGRIEVASQPGQGTTFTVVLPAG